MIAIERIFNVIHVAKLQYVNVQYHIHPVMSVFLYMDIQLQKNNKLKIYIFKSKVSKSHTKCLQ